MGWGAAGGGGRGGSTAAGGRTPPLPSAQRAMFHPAKSGLPPALLLELSPSLLLALACSILMLRLDTVSSTASAHATGPSGCCCAAQVHGVRRSEAKAKGADKNKLGGWGWVGGLSFTTVGAVKRQDSLLVGPFAAVCLAWRWHSRRGSNVNPECVQQPTGS